MYRVQTLSFTTRTVRREVTEEKGQQVRVLRYYSTYNRIVQVQLFRCLIKYQKVSSVSGPRQKNGSDRYRAPEIVQVVIFEKAGTSES